MDVLRAVYIACFCLSGLVILAVSAAHAEKQKSVKDLALKAVYFAGAGIAGATIDVISNLF